MAAHGVHAKTLCMAKAYIDTGKILVAGSGQGQLERRLLSHSIDPCRITSVDIDPSQFKLSAINCEYCDLNQEIPVADNYFDLCFARVIITHYYEKITQA
jgi:hypothetical protein